jgi:membrane-associated protein
MSYRRFLSYNIVGGCLWIGLLVYAGYLFGNIPWVKDNLSLIVVAIVVVSLIPAVSTFVKERRAHKAGARASGVADRESRRP